MSHLQREILIAAIVLAVLIPSGIVGLLLASTVPHCNASACR